MIKLNPKKERLEKANKLIKKIATCGRKFFYHEQTNTTARFLLINNRIYYMDEYTKTIMLTYNHRQLGLNFSQGGTMKGLVLDISEWIRTGKYTNGNNGYGGLFCPHWGYPEKDMNVIREYAKELGYLKEAHP